MFTNLAEDIQLDNLAELDRDFRTGLITNGAESIGKELRLKREKAFAARKALVLSKTSGAKKTLVLDKALKKEEVEIEKLKVQLKIQQSESIPTIDNILSPDWTYYAVGGIVGLGIIYLIFRLKK